MRVEVRLFAIARERAGASGLVVELSTGSSVADLRRAIAAAAPGLQAILPSCALAIDEELADDTTVISPGAVAAVIPPVSGGGGDAWSS